MRVWIIVDTSNRNQIMQIVFETKSAAEYYIRTQGDPSWKAEWMAVYSEKDIRELFPEV